MNFKFLKHDFQILPAPAQAPENSTPIMPKIQRVPNPIQRYESSSSESEPEFSDDENEQPPEKQIKQETEQV